MATFILAIIFFKDYTAGRLRSYHQNNFFQPIAMETKFLDKNNIK